MSDTPRKPRRLGQIMTAEGIAERFCMQILPSLRNPGDNISPFEGIVTDIQESAFRAGVQAAFSDHPAAIAGRKALMALPPAQETSVTWGDQLRERAKHAESLQQYRQAEALRREASIVDEAEAEGQGFGILR